MKNPKSKAKNLNTDSRSGPSSVWKKNLDTMNLLASDPDFQNELKEIRKNLNIPAAGFTNKKEAQRWFRTAHKKSGRILDSKKFIKQEVAIKNKVRGTKEISARMARKQLGLFYEKIPLIYLNNFLDFIIDKFNLPAHFKEYLRNYVLISKINAPKYNFRIGEQVSKKPSLREYLPIRIYTKLSKKDLEALQKHIKPWTQRLPDYNFQPLKNINRDLKIENWYQNNEREDLVGGTTYRMDAREIAENLLNNPKKAQKIYDIIKELKRTRKRRFKKSGD